MAIGPLNNFPLVPVTTGQRQVQAPLDGAEGRRNNARTLDPTTSRFAQELSASDPNGYQAAQQRQKPVALEEISADLPRGSILDITV